MPLPRIEPPTTGDERAMLTGFLDFHRDTLALKCEGLSDWQLKLHAVEPSDLSLLGLVRHLTDVELSWFERNLAGRPTPYHYWDVDHPDRDPDFDEIDHADADAAIALWQRQVAISRQISADLPLDAVGRRTREPSDISHRWVLVHMIEEYSRHNGHADLLRERLDGTTGV